MSITTVLLNIGLCAALTAFVSAVAVLVPMRLDRTDRIRDERQVTSPRPATAQLRGRAQPRTEPARRSAA
jgi:hypothetical protein